MNKLIVIRRDKSVDAMSSSFLNDKRSYLPDQDGITPQKAAYLDDFGQGFPDFALLCKEFPSVISYINHSRCFLPS
jgi:hypothetical protein